MPETLHSVIFVVAVLVIVALAIVAMVHAHKKEKQRTADLIALADSLDLSFTPGKDTSHDELFSQFAVFRNGHSRAAYNTLQGHRDIGGRRFGLRMGDYTYKVTSSNGKQTTTTTYRLSYCVLLIPLAGVPRLLIRPEHLFDKLGSAIGFDDIDFESSEFSKRFFVKSDDKRLCYAIVTPRMMEFLLAAGRPTIDIEGGACLSVHGTRRWPASEFSQRLSWLERFFELWPEHVMVELESRAAT